MKLLIKIPTRERGYNWLNTYTDNITNPDTRILLSIDNDQPYIKQTEIMTVVSGYSQNKIHAINRDINGYSHSWDVLLIGSDDMHPQIKGFDQIILDDMQKYYPDLDGCLWYDTEDLDKVAHINATKGSEAFFNKAICMLPVMGRKYYERFNYVYHSGYVGFWCDNEYTDLARRLNKITYIQNRIVKHEHPSWGGGMANDNLYKKYNQQIFKEDQRKYTKRKTYGFPNT